jgi:4-hydroxy-3-methylbut-2-enyl diphosphate reductase
MVFVRTAFFDVLDMQGDRIVGKETLPILLGEARTMVLLKSVLWVVLILPIVSSLLHLVSYLAFGLAIGPLLMARVLTAYRQGHGHAFVRLEFVVESHFLLTGVVTFLWYLV